MRLDTSQLSDEQLAEEASREGSDGPAFVALLERYQERVWRICWRLMSNQEDASDAAQEVLVRLFVNRGKFGGRSKYSTWVHGVAVRTCLSLRRGRGRRQKHEDRARQQSAESEQRELNTQAAEMSPGELSLDVNEILNSLDEEDRALLIMKYAAGHSYDELAEIFELSTSACKMRVSRIRQRLVEQFPEHRFEQSAE